MDIIAPKTGEHVLLQGIEAKSNPEATASVAESLLARAGVRGGPVFPFALGLLAPVYIRRMVSIVKTAMESRLQSR